MEDPRQKAFIKQLDILLITYYESMKDRFSYDESEKEIERHLLLKDRFVNLWCPTFKDDGNDDHI